MPFGKFKDQLLTDVPASYVEWLEKEGAFIKRPDLRRDFVAIGRIKDSLSYNYTHLRATTLDPFARGRAPLDTDAIPPFWGSGLAFSPSASSDESVVSLSQEALDALEPFREVPAALPSNVVFFDTETVYTTKMFDLEKSFIAQLGAIDGAGREFLCDVCPPVSFSEVNAASTFFAEHNFDRFFAPTNPSFHQAWGRFSRWLWDPAQGRGRVGERRVSTLVAEPTAGARELIYAPAPSLADPTSSSAAVASAAPAPVMLIGHNLAGFDLPHVDKELRRLGLAPSVDAEHDPATGEEYPAPVADMRSQLLAHGGLRFVDTLEMMTLFTALDQSPGRGAWSLTNLLHTFTGSPPARAHDALDDARSVRAFFFADNLAGTFFRAELARQIAASLARAEFDAGLLPDPATLPGAELGLLTATPARRGATARKSEGPAREKQSIFGASLGSAFSSARTRGFGAIGEVPVGMEIALASGAREAPSHGSHSSSGSNGHGKSSILQPPTRLPSGDFIAE
jgi:hypothetical protein